MKPFFFFLAFLLLTATAHADVFDAPCSRYRIPKRLVLAIAKTESGLDPWVVNVAGKDYRPGSRAGALAIIRQARARGLSHDIGLMQINSWWLSASGFSLKKSNVTVIIGKQSVHIIPLLLHASAYMPKLSRRNIEIFDRKNGA